jgi:hypothetical protein
MTNKRFKILVSLTLLSRSLARSCFADGGDGLQIWRISAKILNKQSTRDGPLAFGLSVGLTFTHRRKKPSYQMLKRASELDGSFG